MGMGFSAGIWNVGYFQFFLKKFVYSFLNWEGDWLGF